VTLPSTECDQVHAEKAWTITPGPAAGATLVRAGRRVRSGAAAQDVRSSIHYGPPDQPDDLQGADEMGLLDGIMGNASRIDPRAAAQEFGRLLAQGEQVHAAYQLIRDSFLFTDRRLILVDKQGMTGRKVEYHSIPYRSITHFAVETAGTFDLDAELKIWLSGMSIPIVKQFGKGVDVYEVQALMSTYVGR
jgi:hypothetical protein